jgi:hypothetical protein
MEGPIPHLSTRCPVCGDRVSMPASSQPVAATPDMYAVLHLCTNQTCPGGTIGFYYRSRGDYERHDHWPKFNRYEVSMEVPERPRRILQDANDSRASPIACAAAAVRAVEAMIAHQGYAKRSDSLKARINKAVEQGLLPKVMGAWAHHVRLIGNDTHTDDEPDELPDKDEAKEALTFANTLAEYLYVLPARIPEAAIAELLQAKKCVPK